jgi:hypothetical protein
MKDAPGDSTRERLDRLERRLEELSHNLELLQTRLSAVAVEGGSPESRISPSRADTLDLSLPFELPEKGTFLNQLTLVGRSFLILGGAFLVRSLTDGGFLARPMGVALGLAYACAWTFLADRSAKAGRRASAVYLGITSVVIAFPLIVETTTRWPVFSPAAAAAIMTGMSAVCLAVAWRRNLPALSWSASAAAVVTAVTLSFLTGALEPFASVLLALGIAAVWFAYGHYHWHVLRWPLAAAADLLVLWSALRLLPSDAPPPGSRPAITFFLWLAFALPLLYLGSFGLRTLARRRDVTGFEILQTVAALAIGFGGAVAVARPYPGTLTMLGGSALAVGAACYAVALVFVERRQGLGRNFSFYATMALFLTLSGSALLTSGALLGLFWGALALASAFLAAHWSRLTLAAHSAAYAAAGAWQTGLLRASVDAFGGSASRQFSRVSASGLAIVLVAAASYLLLARTMEKTSLARARFPRSVLIALVVAGCGTVAVTSLRPWIGGHPPGSDPGGMAALRTAILAAAAIVFAGVRRRMNLPELTGLAYAVLLLASIKLLFEDLPQGRASTLFLGFVCYGLALLATPWLLRAAPVPAEPEATRTPDSPRPTAADRPPGLPQAAPRS